MTKKAKSHPESKSGDSHYTSESIQVLEGLEAIRKRPGMYVGGTGLEGLHHLVYECVDNSIDECMAGFATAVSVVLGVDGSCSVSDDGRGMPVDPMKHENPSIHGRPAVEVILTEVHAGGKFDNNAYKVSGGLHGVGVKCVNALSEWTEVEVTKDGRLYRISFERGVVTEPLHVADEHRGGSNGTKISFRPDPEIFADTQLRFETLQHRLRELAFLNTGVKIRLIDERVDATGATREEVFFDETGLAGYVKHLNASKNTNSPVIVVHREDADMGMHCDLALQYTDAMSENLLAFGNNIPNPDGGTHVTGFRKSLTVAINGYGKRMGLFKEKDFIPTGDDLREGLTAVLSVKMRNPTFNNQTKEKLLNPEVEPFISAAITEQLGAWLEENPAEAKSIVYRAKLAAEAREAARKARELIKRKGALDSGGMPHKLSDCSSNEVEKTEMFIVEGDSAGGSAKGGRDHVHQAILPLRGKLLNVEKARLDKVLAFEEIRTLIQALQCGIGEDFDAAKLRYGRVIIMTDADVDGSHIRTLLLTFFFRHMRPLIESGMLYIAQPPLYKLKTKEGERYVASDVELRRALAELSAKSIVLRDLTAKREWSGADLRAVLEDLRHLEETINRAIPVWTRLSKERVLEGYDGESVRSYWARVGKVDHLFESPEKLGDFIELIRASVPAGETLRVCDGPESRVGYEEAHVITARLPHTEELAGVLSSLATRGLIFQGGGNFEVARGRSLVHCTSLISVAEAVRKSSESDAELQRYKGLGEMNPEQLWESTMDPSRRRLYHVRLEDEVAADNIFTLLMSNLVEPRREYIEHHALEVRNLDV